MASEELAVFWSGDDFGMPTEKPWGVAFPYGLPGPTTAGLMRNEYGANIAWDVPDGQLVTVHPTQLYETLAALVIWFIGIQTPQARDQAGYNHFGGDRASCFGAIPCRVLSSQGRPFFWRSHHGAGNQRRRPGDRLLRSCDATQRLTAGKRCPRRLGWVQGRMTIFSRSSDVKGVVSENMTSSTDNDSLDLLVVGAGPTGIAIGAEAKRAGLEALLVDRGPLVANLLDFPTYMTFFTTRDLLEIAGVPFATPQDKPDRRQAIAYYQSIARQFNLEIAPHEEVESARRAGDFFEVVSKKSGEEIHRRAKAVAIATGYFHLPNHLGVPGEEQSWVQDRYIEPYGHFGETVVVVGGGNSALEAALDLWRNDARVILVHRGTSVKETVKYWVRPDFENRVEEGSIATRYESRVVQFGDGYVEIESPSGVERISADAAYVLIGYLPDTDLQKRFGIEIDPVTLVPEFDRLTCETNVPNIYVAGTLQAGRDTGRIFIENSREHGLKIVKNLSQRLAKEPV